MAKSCHRQAIRAPNYLVASFRARYTLHKESCERPDRKARLEEALTAVAGQPVRVELEVVVDEEEVAVRPAPVKSRVQRQREVERHPLVKEAIERFDAEVVRIEGPEG